jgi:WD40-like Beta Propeller Repeat
MRICMALAGCVLVGCASGRGAPVGDDAAPPPIPDAGSVHILGTLSVDPPSRELVISDGVATHATFTAILTAPDGTTKDVTSQTRFQIDARYGTFDTNQLTIGVAARTTIIAAYADKSATADLVARLRSVRVDPGLPSTTPALFDHPDTAALAPAILYPPAEAVMPRNLGDFEIHWTDAHANTVFEVSLHTDLTDVRVYVAGNNGIAAQGPTPSWTAFSSAEWLAAVGDQGAVTYQVRGANPAIPGNVGGEPGRVVQLSNEVMDGGLYYWATATAATKIGIFRHDMKRPGEPAEEYLTTDKTNGRCVACHVLSRDGKKMAITYEDVSSSGAPLEPGPATLVDVETKMIAPQTERWDFGTFTPDNAQFLSVIDGVLVVRDATTQAVLATMTVDPARPRVSQPDLSPDGTQLVYVRFLSPEADYSFGTGQIFRRSYNAQTLAFGPEIAVATDQNSFYPSWSPDGAWILFNKILAGLSYDNSNSAPWVVKADGSQPPVQLARATQELATDSWPRWAPFPQTLGDAQEPMFWITMSSKRDFGVRLRNTSVAHRAQRAQLWMTPFFPARAALGQDPSAPPFRLPFQNLESSNHTAQWTQRVIDVIQ